MDLVIKMQTRDDVIKYIKKQFDVEPDHPFKEYPKYLAFRHKDDQKWFALIMDVPKDRLGLDGTDEIDVLDVKVDPDVAGLLKQSKGYLPAYHMNKEHWITIVLGDVDSKQVQKMIKDSFKMTQ